MAKNLQTPIPMLYIWKNYQAGDMENKKTKVVGLHTSANNTSVNDLQKTLVCSVDKSCELQVETFTPYPAILEEYGATCRGYGGYRISLAPFKGLFSAIRFRGKGNGKKAVCGYVINTQGYVEAVATECDSDGYATLPLTSSSHALFASVPMKSGKPVWESITVQLIKSTPHLIPLVSEVDC